MTYTRCSDCNGMILDGDKAFQDTYFYSTYCSYDCYIEGIKLHMGLDKIEYNSNSDRCENECGNCQFFISNFSSYPSGTCSVHNYEVSIEEKCPVFKRRSYETVDNILIDTGVNLIDMLHKINQKK